jgi:alkylation response protein AidB-like acyl-CoA dehydrogenase
VCGRRADDGEPALVVIDGRGGARPPIRRRSTRKIFALDLDGVQVSEAELLAGDATAALATTLDEARVALAAEMAGGAERVLEMTVEHVKTRRQFGQPIGAFQAVQHASADMMVAVECAKAAVTYAAWALAEPADDASIAAATAKATAGEATAGDRQRSSSTAASASPGSDLHIYYKRAMSRSRVRRRDVEPRARRRLQPG